MLGELFQPITPSLIFTRHVFAAWIDCNEFFQNQFLKEMFIFVVIQKSNTKCEKNVLTKEEGSSIVGTG